MNASRCVYVMVGLIERWQPYLRFRLNDRDDLEFPTHCEIYTHFQS